MLLILNSFYASYINVQYEKKEQKYLPSNRNLTIMINYWIIDVNAVQGIFMKLVGCSKESLVVNCILNMLYTVIYTVIHCFFLSKGKEKNIYHLLQARSVDPALKQSIPPNHQAFVLPSYTAIQCKTENNNSKKNF